MDVEYFGLMLLRGIGQAGLPIAGIKQITEDNSLFNVETADKSQFLIKIEKFKPKPDLTVQGKADWENCKGICSIYDSLIQIQKQNKTLLHNKFDMGWLEDKLNTEDYCRLENSLLNSLLNDTLKDNSLIDQSDKSNDLYSDISKRLNLQAIGYFIKEESTLNSIHRTSFTKRDADAEKVLRKTLEDLLDEKTAEVIYHAILDYTSIKEEIQFSLGMKTGAKLTLLLTDNSEYDF